jgi:hypothetical protein
MTDFRNRLQYSPLLYHLWYVLAALCLVAAVWCSVVGAWPWVLGWTVGAIALAAHARLERLDGHKHSTGVEAP